jgi:NADPH:quinone reductase-like Zn-dependent oxidoreductase
MLLKSGGRIIDIVPTAAKFARSALPGPYKVVIAQPITKDLDELARACGQGTLRLPIAHTAPLRDAIAALTELERNHKPKGGKLIITTAAIGASSTIDEAEPAPRHSHGPVIG